MNPTKMEDAFNDFLPFLELNYLLKIKEENEEKHIQIYEENKLLAEDMGAFSLIMDAIPTLNVLTKKQKKLIEELENFLSIRDTDEVFELSEEVSPFPYPLIDYLEEIETDEVYLIDSKTGQMLNLTQEDLELDRTSRQRLISVIVHQLDILYLQSVKAIAVNLSEFLEQTELLSNVNKENIVDEIVEAIEEDDEEQCFVFLSLL